MYHSTSGKIGYALHDTPSRGTLTRDEMSRIFVTEDRLRATPTTQSAYTSAQTNYSPSAMTTQAGMADPGGDGSMRPQAITACFNRVLKVLATITEELQAKALLAELGHNRVAELGGTEGALTALHNGRFLWQSDSDLNQLTVYQRFDKSRNGPLRVGDPAPNVPLLRLEPAEPDGITHTDISTLEQPGRPLVLVCGSIS
jgi:hypothetical protein